jgi:isopropylmalate/homocitrate/citramalate synthase
VKATLCDVGPRDGLQNEPETLAPGVRAELVNRLAAAGLARVEAVSFVRDERVPRMAGAEDVVAAIERREGVEYSGLVLNERGYERFRAAGLDRVNVTFAATESFNQANGNASLEEAVARVEAIGVATPSRVRELVARTKAEGFHGHNTRNTGYANCLAALDGGARVLDASVGGLGGCPYAPRATGNVATEDLVYLLEGEGIDTGVDLDALIGVSAWLEQLLGRTLEGYVYRAGPWPPSS